MTRTADGTLACGPSARTRRSPGSSASMSPGHPRHYLALGAALACVAGVMIGILVQIRPLMGFDMLLPMFAAAILGGIG